MSVLAVSLISVHVVAVTDAVPVVFAIISPSQILNTIVVWNIIPMKKETLTGRRFPQERLREQEAHARRAQRLELAKARKTLLDRHTGVTL